MKLSDLKDKIPVPLLEVEVTGWEEVVSYGDGAGTMWPVMVKDDSGEGKVKLFGQQITNYEGEMEIGSKLIISKGWCKVFKGLPEITTGKFGELFVLNK